MLQYLSYEMGIMSYFLHRKEAKVGGVHIIIIFYGRIL